MIGRLQNVFRLGSGRYMVTAIVNTAVDMMSEFNRLRDQDIDCEFKEHKEKRSVNANSYFHVLVNKISKAVNASDDQIKHRLNINYGTIMRGDDGSPAGAKIPSSINIGVIDGLYARAYKHVVENGIRMTCYILYKPTHLLDTQEFSRLLDGAISEAKAIGIETMTPNELSRLTGYEGRKTDNV